jgi:8-oxo-dGTP pyrophosphatase MutT (NUDIX family)
MAMSQAKAPLLPHWEVVTTSEIYRNDFFRLRRDSCSLQMKPEMTAQHYVLEMPDAVLVVPETDAGLLVMVEQYRHGAAGEFLEFPGGQLDPGDVSLETAARRELLEETGYEVSSLRYLGAHYPNPGAQTNRVHTYLATVTAHAAGPLPDEFENLRVVLLSRAELARRIREGVEVASSTLAALSLLSLLTGPEADSAPAAD